MASIVNTKGVDISYWNGDINLSKVKAAGYNWVMIRCGFGNNSTSNDDSRFGNEIGSTTNKITSMYDVRAGFPVGSLEYEILSYRIKCGQLYQQNKGCILFTFTVMCS